MFFIFLSFVKTRRSLVAWNIYRVYQNLSLFIFKLKLRSKCLKQSSHKQEIQNNKQTTNLQNSVINYLNSRCKTSSVTLRHQWKCSKFNARRSWRRIYAKFQLWILNHGHEMISLNFLFANMYKVIIILIITSVNISVFLFFFLFF